MDMDHSSSFMSLQTLKLCSSLSRLQMAYTAAVISIIMIILSGCNAQSCTQTISPANYVAFPSVFDSVSVINPGVPGCSLYENVFFQCSYSVVLGDGVSVPSPPNLNDRDYVENFIAWERIAIHPYVDFDLTGSTMFVHKIELSFLNNPVNNISLPDIELFDVTPTENRLVKSVLLDNQDLTQGDNQIRTVTVLPVLTSQPGITLRISLSFAETYDFDWFLLSEVRFCSDLQPNYQPVVMFEFPIPNTTIQPSAEALREGSTEVLCTVSSQGLYTWQWRKDSGVIQNGGSKYRISVGEGSRTTKLMISALSFSDAGQYECTASTLNLRHNTVSLSQMQDIEFPANLITAPDVAGFRDTGEVVISCELHGYQSSITPPVWLNKDLSRITDTINKYTITEDQGTNTVVLENGTAVPSLIVRLTIRQLGPEDAGIYTCCSGTEESMTQLTIMEGTAPPTTVPPPTTGPHSPSVPEDQNQDETTQANCILMTWLAATMIVVSAVLLAAVVSLSITIFFLLAKNKRMATALANAVATYQLEPNTQQPDAEYEVIPEGVHRHIVTEMKTNESYGKLQARDAPPPETGGSGESTYEAVEVGN